MHQINKEMFECVCLSVCMQRERESDMQRFQQSGSPTRCQVNPFLSKKNSFVVFFLFWRSSVVAAEHFYTLQSSTISRLQSKLNLKPNANTLL